MTESEDCEKRTKFGNRLLEDQADVFKHNAWDNVSWDEEFYQEVVYKISANSQEKLSNEKATELEENSNVYWDKFYSKHENKFFKDRHWIFTEFPELLPEPDRKDSPKLVLELGCGVGNTVFPLIEIDREGALFIYCCDFSDKAVEIVKENKLYDEKHCQAFVLDITSKWNNIPFGTQCLDIVTMIFVLSAIDPLYHSHVLQKIFEHLKPGGKLLFRDYGYCDLTQARFKNGRCIKSNFYVRGDGTRAYFFQEDEVDKLLVAVGFNKINLHIDRRLQVNRANKKKMYRIWIQAVYEKPSKL